MKQAFETADILLHLSEIMFLCSAGLPVQVRDAALKVTDNMPKTDVNKEYYQQNMEREVCILCFLPVPHGRLSLLASDKEY